MILLAGLLVMAAVVVCIAQAAQLNDSVVRSVTKTRWKPLRDMVGVKALN